MNQFVTDLLPYVIGPVVTAVILWYGAINRLRTKVAVGENRISQCEAEIRRIERRVDKKSEQFDEIQQKLAAIQADLAGLTQELRTSLDILKKTV